MVLELEEALDRVPIATQGRAECGRFDPVSDRLDIRPGALGGYGLVQGVAVAGRVCEQDPPRLRAVVHLTPGNASDVETAPEVLAAAPGRLKRPGADRGYGADRLRRDSGGGRHDTRHPRGSSEALLPRPPQPQAPDKDLVRRLFPWGGRRIASSSGSLATCVTCWGCCRSVLS